MILLSDNGVSRVWRDGKWVIKRQPKYLTENEIWCLQKLYPTGFVPYAERVGIEELRIEYIENERVTDARVFMRYYQPVLNALCRAGIRHGDLTKYAVLVQDNKPILIDFAESRLWNDPRPDKRPEGDAYWLKKTMEALCGDIISERLSFG